MSDQGKWAKLWVSILSDPELENLELHQWARWVRILIFIKGHGTNGKVVFKAPFRALQNVLRVQSFDELKAIVSSLPNYTIMSALHETVETPLHDKDDGSEKFMLVCRNWTKYQGDISTDRVKKYRAKSSVSKDVTSNGKCNGLRREEKRRDVKSTSTSTPRASRSPALAAGGATREGEEKEVDFEEMEMRERNQQWRK